MPTVGTTHHVKLGNEFLIVRPNSYTKRAAPTFGARVSSGDPDYNNLSIWQHWVQSCWVGGMDAPEWVDDAMFDTSVGVDTTQHEVVRMSRHLKRGSTPAGWTLGGSTGVRGYRFVIFESILYVLVMTATDTDSRLYRYDVGAESWTVMNMPGSNFQARAMCGFDGKLWVGGWGTGGAIPKLFYNDTPATGGTWVTQANAPGIGSNVALTISAMRVYNGKMYVAYGRRVWRLKDNLTWDGSTVFYQANAASTSGAIVNFETHLGFLYMLSNNGHIHRSDGNNTFDIWSWDNNTAGVSLRSYDGKLFVGTYEYTDAANLGSGVLYQFTGSAVTELKRWGKTGKTTTIGNMVVYDRRLFYGASGLFGARNGFGIACYDAVEDSHSIYAMNDDSTTYPDASGTGADWQVDDVVVYGGKLFCTTRKHGVFFTEDSFRDVQVGSAQYSTSATGGLLVSSMYNAGTPGLMKLWDKITVFCDLPTNTSFTLSYSLDNGATYTALATQSGPSPADGQYQFMLNNIRGTRFKWKITLKTIDETKTPALRAVIVAYLPQPEPGWLWSFTVPVTDKWELMDGTIETKTPETLITYLEGLFRAQSMVTFIDADGVTWASAGPGVLVYDLSTVYYDINATREADVRITLLETVESY